MILTLILVGSAISIVAWLAASRHHRKRNVLPVEEERAEEPNESQPVTTDAASQPPQESLQCLANTPSIQVDASLSDEPVDGVSPTVEHENPHPDTSLTPGQEAASEAARPIALPSETSKLTRKEFDIRLAPEEFTNSVVEKSLPEIPPPEEPRFEDQQAVPDVTEATEERKSEAAPSKEANPRRQRPHVSPEDRGGRSRETVSKKEGGGEKKRRIRTPKPEIVCWKREREWVLAVEMPDSFPRNRDVTVIQDGQPLQKDDAESDCWRLVQLHGEVVVRVLDGETERPFTLPLGGGCLNFKLSGDDHGRHVKRPGSGSYLAVVPGDWERDEALAGPPRIAPEDVCLSGFCAHFFELMSNSGKLAFRDGSGRSVVIGSGGPVFQLVGEQVHDAGENLGPLFASAPPRIRVADGTWESVGTIVLGEEGRGIGRWRKAIKPKPYFPEQTMPDELINRRAGWYFVRFYDHEDELIDSLDFRFCTGLRQLRTETCQPFPSAAGHEVVTVELAHESEWHVAASFAGQDGVAVERKSDRTILKIPPQPDCDLTRWKFGIHGGPQVEIVLLIERVWWAVGDVGSPPPRWRDTCLVLSVDDFAATSERAIWLRLPKPRWTDRVRAGFHPEKRRPYPLRVTEHMVAIPLRDFSDAPVLVDRARDCALKVWVNESEATLATVPAETTGGTLDVARISACHMAQSLTLLHAMTRGPLRQLLRETRRRYRRPRHSKASGNIEFMQEALCVVAVFLQLAAAAQSVVPKAALRWRSKSRLAGKQFPDTMRQIWRRYRELEGRTTGR